MKTFLLVVFSILASSRTTVAAIDTSASIDVSNSTMRWAGSSFRCTDISKDAEGNFLYCTTWNPGGMNCASYMNDGHPISMCTAWFIPSKDPAKLKIRAMEHLGVVRYEIRPGCALEMDHSVVNFDADGYMKTGPDTHPTVNMGKDLISLRPENQAADVYFEGKADPATCTADISLDAFFRTDVPLTMGDKVLIIDKDAPISDNFCQYYSSDLTIAKSSQDDRDGLAVWINDETVVLTSGKIKRIQNQFALGFYAMDCIAKATYDYRTGKLNFDSASSMRPQITSSKGLELKKTRKTYRLFGQSSTP